MKKLFLIIAVLGFLTAMSCKDQKQSPVDNPSSVNETYQEEMVKPQTPGEMAIALTEEFTQKMEKATTIEEVENLCDEWDEKLDSFDKLYSDYTPTVEEQKNGEEAETKRINALKAKFQELGIE